MTKVLLWTWYPHVDQLQRQRARTTAWIMVALWAPKEFDGAQNPCEVLSSTHPLHFITVYLDKHRHLLPGAKHIELLLWHSTNFVDIIYFIRHPLYLTEYNLKSRSLLYFLLPVIIIIIIPCIHHEEI